MNGRSNSSSSNTNGQSSDHHEPVIVHTPRAGGKAKQTFRPHTPTSPVTRFLRVDHVHAGDFEDGKPLGRVKGLVSTVRP
jgi:hypothetical protein